MNYNLKNINKPLIACLKTIWYWTTDLEVDDLVYCVKNNASILYLADQSQQLRGIFSLFIGLWYISVWIFFWWVPFEFSVHGIQAVEYGKFPISLGLDNFPRPVLNFERGCSYPVGCMTWKGESNVLITRMQ